MRAVTSAAIGFVVGGVLALSGMSAATATPVPNGATAGGSASADAPARTRNASIPTAGGLWTYGVGGGNVFSVFEHDRARHSAAVRSSGITKSSGWKSAGTLASATRPSAWSGNQSFWNVG